MHRLKGLIWKAYKVRLRSPYTTALEFGGPIIIIVFYLILKVLLSSFPVTLEPELNSAPLFRNVAQPPLALQSDIQRHLCTKVLFYSPSGPSSPVADSIAKLCGLELVSTSSRNELLSRLESSLNKRIAFRKEGFNLARQNSSTSGGCFTLDGAQEPSYQAAIVMSNEQSGNLLFEIHMTDLASSSVIYQPYTQGSTYNEYRIPQSDLNSGLYLLEICLGRAVSASRRSNNSRYSSDYGEVSHPRAAPNNSFPDNTGAASPGDYLDTNWRVKSLPVVTSTLMVPILFLCSILAANLCTSILTVMRVAEDNESGLHHYIRASGVPAGLYWLSHVIVTGTHLALLNLVMAIILAIPASSSQVDPVQELNIAIRWLLLFSYSFAINVHGMFVASLFEKTSHALLVTCLLAVNYAVYPFIFHVQYTPYSFSTFGIVSNVVLLNPVSNYQALLLVIFEIYMQTGRPLHWSQLTSKIPGGGMTNWSVGALWSLLIGQTILWFMLTIFIDQFYYSSSRVSLAFLGSLIKEMFCSNCIQPEAEDQAESVRTKSSHPASKSSLKKLPDPYRICCSLRHISVTGPTIMMAHARGNPLKMDTKQMEKLKKENLGLDENHPIKYVINRNKRSLSSSEQYRAGSAREQPILIDEAVLQHIVWQRTNITLENLSLDFRFNQVSFILGQTDVKELLFSSLMGLRTLHSGHIVLDGARYSPSSVNLGRSQVGFLGERDIFLNDLTIYENLQFFGSLRDGSYSQYDSESQFVLNLLHLSSRRDDWPTSLTSRSSRKLALGVAAVGHTKLLLLVEPTLGLRWKPRCQVLNLLKKYKSIRSIVVDTSDLDEASAFGDRIVLLKNGRADLDGTPEYLRRKLGCGYWLVLEPVAGSRGSPASGIHALEKLTNDIFKKDKVELLSSSRRSVYQQIVGDKENHAASKVSSAGSMALSLKKSSKNVGSKTPSASSTIKSATLKGSTAGGVDDDRLHKNTVILKVRNTSTGVASLCTLLRMFSQHNVHGFRLASLAYESLEDVMVLRMSKGLYPDLPPDLLLSLQHRTHANKSNPPQVSVRKCESDFQVPKVARPVFGARFFAILKDRAANKQELLWTILTLVSSLLIVCASLYALRESLSPAVHSGSEPSTNSRNWRAAVSSASVVSADEFAIDHDQLVNLFEDRIGFYVMIDKQDESASAEAYLNRWTHNKRLTGVIRRDFNESDAEIAVSFIKKSKDLAISLVVYDLKSGVTTVVYESNLAHALTATIKTFLDYQLTSGGGGVTTGQGGEEKTRSTHGVIRGDTSQTAFKIEQFQYQQPWHGIIRGYQTRRFFYALGFAFAEGIAIGIVVLAPIRHRSESREIKLRVIYWIAMATFDLAISLIVVIGYVVLVLLFEWTYTYTSLIYVTIVFVLYKLGAIPLAYLVSLVVETSRGGFLFILIVYLTVGWVFSIQLKTFIEWVLHGQGYLFTITNWVILATPINAVIETLTNINHVHYMNELCKQVPAYAATSNLVPKEGEQRITVIDMLITKVDECLSKGKQGIPIDVMHEQTFGILWDVYLIVLFDIIVWTFLIFSEKVFGLLSRRFTSVRTTNDFMKTVIRSSDMHSNMFKWDREKDRLVSEYIRCMNEINYVKQMVTNCMYLRIWLKPMSEDNTIDKRLADIVEPLIASGQDRQDIHIELKTTLQIFIRIGNEKSRCKLDRVQLLETFAKFAKQHEDKVVKFAVVDWTRETLYKILIHGHYNTKCAPTIT